MNEPAPHGSAPETRPARKPLMLGASLILLGVGLFVVRIFVGPSEPIFFLTLGILFIAGYVRRKRHGLLIAGCVLMGLGLGAIGENSGLDINSFTMTGLGIGFIAIFVIDLLVRRTSSWWPLIPGGILVFNGLGYGTYDLQDAFSIGWPLILVLVGLVFVVRALRR